VVSPITTQLVLGKWTTRFFSKGLVGKVTCVVRRNVLARISEGASWGPVVGGHKSLRCEVSAGTISSRLRD